MKQWSEYQVNVFNAIKAMGALPKASLMIEAVAGSGKTTTIVEALKLIDVRHRVVFLAFNKHIADELKVRVPPNCEARTMNSFGNSCINAVTRRKKLDQYKTRNILKWVLPDQEKRRSWEGLVARLVGLRKATLNGREFLPWAELAGRYDVDMPLGTEFATVIDSVWAATLEDPINIDFDDQWFHPVYYDLPVPQYDWAFVDEAQDLCSTQIELLKRIAPRIVAVGDPRQSIYGFRGADPEAMDRLRVATSAEVLPLSICYRCPSKVIDEANKVFGHQTPVEAASYEQHAAMDGAPVDARCPPFILPAPGAPEGEVGSIDVKLLRQEAKPGSYVLCRTTAPLVKECLKFIVEGVKATVKGRDIGQQLVSLVRKVSNDVDLDISTFTMKLEEFFQSEKRRLEAAERDVQLQALEDRVECIHALSEGARTTDDIEVRIDKVFQEEASDGVTFATAHRTKGLEASEVFILCPELMPFPKAKSKWAKQQELNLKYVAVTRAMKRLRWVTGAAKVKA